MSDAKTWSIKLVKPWLVTHKLMWPVYARWQEMRFCLLLQDPVRLCDDSRNLHSFTPLCTPPVSHKIFLYTHEKIHERFWQLQLHFPKALILNLTDLPNCVWINHILNNFLEVPDTTLRASHNQQFERPRINKKFLFPIQYIPTKFRHFLQHFIFSYLWLYLTVRRGPRVPYWFSDRKHECTYI